MYLQLLPELAAERNEYDPSKCDCDPKFIEMLNAGTWVVSSACQLRSQLFTRHLKI